MAVRLSGWAVTLSLRRKQTQTWRPSHPNMAVPQLLQLSPLSFGDAPMRRNSSIELAQLDVAEEAVLETGRASTNVICAVAPVQWHWKWRWKWQYRQSTSTHP